MLIKELDQLLSWSIDQNKKFKIQLFLENLSNKDTSLQSKLKVISNNSSNCLTLLY